MNRRSARAGLFLCLATSIPPALATAQRAGSGAPPPLFVPQQLAEGFHIFRTALKEGNPGVYR